MKFNTKLSLIIAVFAFLLFNLSGCATYNELSRIDRIVVFGDSNVDTGNLAKLFGGVVPRANMWQGRNSNGPVVTEYLAESLNAELVTFAVSGALTGDSNIVALLAPELSSVVNTGTLKQIANFEQDGQSFGERDLIVLWAGSNDIYRADRKNTVELKRRIGAAVNNLEFALEMVAELGANKIVVGLRTPRPQLDSDDDLNGQDLNRAIVASIRNRQTKSDLDIKVFDAYATIKEMIQRPDGFGFLNVSGLCVEDQQCLNERYEDGLNIANTYVNWDGAHKTTRVHFIMASKLNQLLME